MTTIRTKDSDGSVVIYANPACPPAPKKGCTIRTVDALPARPANGKTSVLLWQNNALAWVTPALTPAQTFAAAVAAGYTVPGVTPPLVLDLSDAAQNRFTGLLLLLNTSVAAGRMTTADSFPITDIDGNPRAFSVANVQTMILGYGEYYAGLFVTLHAAALAAAS